MELDWVRRVERVSELKQKILDGIRISGLQDWALTVDEHEIVEYEGLTDEDIDELATYILDEIIKKPTLNENQMIVLDYLKRQAPTGKPLQVIFWLMNTVAWDKLDELRNPIMHLTNKEQAQVLQAFATWVEQEEE